MEQRRFLDEVNSLRGIWDNKAQGLLAKHLREEHRKAHSDYSDLPFEDVIVALKLVTRYPGMYVVDHYNTALDYCHTRGVIHSRYVDEKWHYMFASRIHQKFALFFSKQCYC